MHALAWCLITFMALPVTCMVLTWWTVTSYLALVCHDIGGGALTVAHMALPRRIVTHPILGDWHASDPASVGHYMHGGELTRTCMTQTW